MLAKDGELICNINRKKVEWYLSRGIAELVSEDPPTIRLLFEAGGRGNAGDDFYLSTKENRCVACGSKEQYVRFSIVPHNVRTRLRNVCSALLTLLQYRKWMPDRVKGRSSFDIVLLCPRCTVLMTRAQSIEREAVSLQFNVALAGNMDKWIVDKEKVRIRTLAITLSKKRMNIPAERKEQMRQELQEIVKEDITQELLEQLAKIEPKTENPEWKSHEQLVVEMLRNDEALEEFVRRWRRNFINNAKPRFLHPLWSIDAPVYRDH
jgi:hypothetical protein